MSEFIVPPDPMLLESMRAVGYTIETSVADIVDNSISAGANTVWIRSSGSGLPRLSITDDGHGMSEDELTRAMRLGAVNPGAHRAVDDLGRFGLGLKTASLAHARRLTVVTKTGDAVAARRWDLDHVRESEKWALLALDSSQLGSVPEAQFLREMSSGTVVIWENFDQLPPDTSQQQEELDASMVRVREHLALVFHRFISGDGGRKVSLMLNATPIAAVDPFLASSKRTIKDPEQTITVAGVPITVQSFTLPYVNKMTKSEREAALAPGLLRDSQGFYIYRARRLVIWGTWFRLTTRSELGKLARVKVDIPNSLDHLWSLDIKKSVATPPTEVRLKLRQFADRMIQPSKNVHKYRGRTEKSSSVTHMWSLVKDRDSFRYEINSEHPLVRQFYETLDADQARTFQQLTGAIETSFPLEDAHNRMSGDAVSTQAAAPDDTLKLSLELWQTFRSPTRTLEDFLAVFAGSEPFVNTPDFESRFRRLAGEGETL